MAVMIFVVTVLFDNRLCRLVEDHTKTLERVNELWKQKWPVTWDEVWLYFYSLSLLSLSLFPSLSVCISTTPPPPPPPSLSLSLSLSLNPFTPYALLALSSLPTSLVSLPILSLSPRLLRVYFCQTTHTGKFQQAWEEKHATVQLGADGFAGFSVVGGRDQPQLPNPGAFIITTVNQGGPAEGMLKYVVYCM